MSGQWNMVQYQKQTSYQAMKRHGGSLPKALSNEAGMKILPTMSLCKLLKHDLVVTGAKWR